MRMTTTILAALATACAAVGQLEPVWTFESGNAALGAPKLVDLDADGVLDVVQATGGPPGNAVNDGYVYAFDLSGQMLDGFPIHIDRPIFHAVAVADLDADGGAELVAQAWASMYVWNADGSVADGWPIATGTFSSNAPALADLDGDGSLDIIYPADIAMHAVGLDGEPVEGWPRFAKESFQAPSVADLDGDGEPEVVAGTWRPQFPDQVDFELYAWNADGSLVDGFPVGSLGSVRGSVSLGDLEGDGSIELVTRAGDVLHVLDASGEELDGWPVSPAGPIRNATPTLGDLDQDGDLEIVIGGFDVFAYHHDGSPVDGFPVDTDTTSNINSSAAIVNADSESESLEILVKISDAVEGFNSDGTDVEGFPFALDDNNSTGTFSPGPAAADMDADGTVEMAFVSNNGTIVLLDEGADALVPLQWQQTGFDALNTSFIPREVQCAADCNDDGSLDVLDFVCFQQAWQAQSLYGDCNGDGEYDVTDFVCYQLIFQEGCE